MPAENEKWYFKTSVLVIAILCVGPFALPLAWLNPRYSKMNKVIITLAVILFTAILAASTASSLNSIAKYYGELSKI